MLSGHEGQRPSKELRHPAGGTTPFHRRSRRVNQQSQRRNCGRRATDHFPVGAAPIGVDDVAGERYRRRLSLEPVHLGRRASGLVVGDRGGVALKEDQDDRSKPYRPVDEERRRPRRRGGGQGEPSTPSTKKRRRSSGEEAEAGLLCRDAAQPFVVVGRRQ